MLEKSKVLINFDANLNRNFHFSARFVFVFIDLHSSSFLLSFLSFLVSILANGARPLASLHHFFFFISFSTFPLHNVHRVASHITRSKRNENKNKKIKIKSETKETNKKRFKIKEKKTFTEKFLFTLDTKKKKSKESDGENNSNGRSEMERKSINHWERERERKNHKISWMNFLWKPSRSIKGFRCVNLVQGCSTTLPSPTSRSQLSAFKDASHHKLFRIRNQPTEEFIWKENRFEKPAFSFLSPQSTRHAIRRSRNIRIRVKRLESESSPGCASFFYLRLLQDSRKFHWHWLSSKSSHFSSSLATFFSGVSESSHEK